MHPAIKLGALPATPARWPRAKTAALPFAVWLLLAYLAGITIIGKGPTYLGYPPLFWGEVVMAVSLVWIAPWCGLNRALQGQLGWVTVGIGAWLIIGAVLTTFSFPQYGLEAIRDAAIWYYALFYFVGLGLANRVKVADRFWRVMLYIWVFALIWGAADLASGKKLSEMGPIIPWRGVPLFFNARDETGQNLALGALLVLCSRTLPIRGLTRYLLSAFALAGLALLAASEGRAVKLGLTAAMMILLVFSFSPRPIALARRSRTLAVLAIPAAILLLLLVPDLAHHMQLDRFMEANPKEAEGTAYWRLLWWERLAAEVMSRNPLFGLGFGESLHLYHPALEKLSDPWMLRAPHNFSVTVMTRMGFVGLALFLALSGGTLLMLALRVWRGRTSLGRYSDRQREELLFWCAMIAYTFVNSTFGVLMEGPVLGIWFWLAMGFALGRSERPDVPERVVILSDLRRTVRRMSLR